jgi:hypothetical protein
MTNWFYALIAFLVIGWACFAEDITTGNLLPNGNNNASNYQSVDTKIPNITTDGFNTSGGIRNWGQEIETTGTGSINYTGTLLDVTTGNDTTTQDKLDNGVTLNSTTIVQNCEYQGSNWQCGQAKPGQDTFKTTVKILDKDGNILATVNQLRNNDAGYWGNALKYTDSVTHAGTGANKFYWEWEGVDMGYAQYNTNLGGPNLLGAKLTMTYDNVVLQAETIEVIEEVIDDIIEWESAFLPPVIAPPVAVVPPVFELEEEFVLQEEPVVIETLEELEEEFEEVEILEVWGGPEVVEEPLEEEPNEPEEIEPEIIEAEQVVENEPTETTSAEVEETTEEPEVESPVVAEAEVEEEEPTVEISVQDIQAQVSAKIESVEKSLATTSIVAAQVMTSKQVDLSSYYKTYTDDRKMYEGNDYTDLRILGGLDIYAENNNKFLRISSNDPVLKYQRELQDATMRRIQLEKELQILRR